MHLPQKTAMLLLMFRFIPILSLIAIFGIVIIGNHISPASSKENPELVTPAIVENIRQSSGNFDTTATQAFWEGHPVPLPGREIAEKILTTPDVLGVNTTNKWIEVDLSNQLLVAHEDNNIAFQFPVSSGLPWTPTVTGEYYIWAKVKAQRMTGGSKENNTYYDLPNVPFVQYFYKGYGLHGAYWHKDFGKPRSHGCVNISIPDAEKLFYWTNPPLPSNKHSNSKIKPEESTRVIIHGNTPVTNIW